MSTISQKVTPPEDPHAGDELLTIVEVADVLRVPVATLRYWRHLGTGPHSFRIGRGVRYWRSEVSAWLLTCKKDCRTFACFGDLSSFFT